MKLGQHNTSQDVRETLVGSGSNSCPSPQDPGALHPSLQVHSQSCMPEGPIQGPMEILKTMTSILGVRRWDSRRRQAVDPCKGQFEVGHSGCQQLKGLLFRPFCHIICQRTACDINSASPKRADLRVPGSALVVSRTARCCYHIC
jgi:hypothetical protein